MNAVRQKYIMFVKINSTVPLYRFSMFDALGSVMQHAVFTRHGGISAPPFDSLNVRWGIGDPDQTVVKNRAIVQHFFEKEFLSNGNRTLISANQTHSDHIAVLAQGERLPEFPEIDDVDALITDRTDILLMIQVADCQPIILIDPKKHVLGMAHSGWKGSVQNILGKTVKKMVEAFGADPGHICAAIGPSLGPCCSYFTDPENELPARLHPYITTDKRVDFWKVSHDQLTHEGVTLDHIVNAQICTFDHTDEFYSYRRSRLTGRFGVLAGLV